MATPCLFSSLLKPSLMATCCCTCCSCSQNTLNALEMAELASKLLRASLNVNNAATTLHKKYILHLDYPHEYLN